MDRYCELMGVANPNDLPAVYPKREDAPGISVGSVRVNREGYKGGVLKHRETHLPTMPHGFTDEEWPTVLQAVLSARLPVPRVYFVRLHNQLCLHNQLRLTRHRQTPS